MVSNNEINNEDKIVLSLIVTTYNRHDVLQRFLDSILKQDHKYKFEIILVNQGQPDEEMQRLFKQHSWQLIECNGQMPLSIARNKALSMYRGRLIGFPDDDCWYHPQIINNIVDKFNDYPLYEAICVSVFDPIKNKPYGNRPNNLSCDITFKNVVQLPVSVGIFTRDNILKARGIKFNETLGAGTFYGGGEETAFLCSILKNKGKIIYDGSLCVYHEVDDYNQISLEKVKKYSRGYGYIVGGILANKRYEVIVSILFFTLKSIAALLIRGYKKKYLLMYSTRIKFFFVGIIAAFRSKEAIF